MKTITKESAAVLMSTAKGIFSVTFIKRSTGETRTLNGIAGFRTRKDLAGGSLPYVPAEHNLFPMFLMSGDMNREDAAVGKNRRMVPLDGIVSLKVDGQEYIVN